MSVSYTRVDWENKPSTATKINATNLNVMDKGIDDVVTRVNELVEVEANPQGTATGTLSKIGIDGDIYSVSGGGGGGGHTIENDSGTDLTQREVLQAKGVYSHDDSTNQKTVIEVVREYNSEADIQALSGESAKGFQNLGNSLYYNKKLMNSLPEYSLAQYNALTNKPDYWVRNDAPSGDRGINAQDIAYDSNTSVKEKIDSVALKMSIVTINNGQNTVTIDLPFTGNGQIFLYNANRGIVGLIKIEPSQTTPITYTNILGNKNPSFSLSNNVLSINWGERTWGTTCYMLTWE